MLIKSQINFKGILIWKNKAEPSDKKQKKLIVRDGKINVSASFLNGKSMSVNLPSLTLSDIEKDKGVQPLRKSQIKLSLLLGRISIKPSVLLASIRLKKRFKELLKIWKDNSNKVLVIQKKS